MADAIRLLLWRWLQKRKRLRIQRRDFSLLQCEKSSNLLKILKKNENFRVILSIIVSTVIEHRVWSRLRLSTFFEVEMMALWDNDQWKKHMRMSKEVFLKLVEKSEPFIPVQQTRMRPSTPVVKRVAMTVYYLADGTSLRTLGNLFGVAQSSACLYTSQVCSVIATYLLKEYVKWPVGSALKEVIQGFASTWGFPQCAGAIDGSHIPIKAPIHYPKDYWNRKQFHSIIIQAVVDHHYMLTNVNVGWPGSVHDARVLASSSIFKFSEEGCLFPQEEEWKQLLAGRKISPLIIGDAAYPLLPWLLKPFSDNGHLSPDQARFNYRLSRARMVVECFFGRLKGRWRILLTKIDADLTKVVDVVLACCVLHNFCEVMSQEFDPSLTEQSAVVTDLVDESCEDLNYNVVAQSGQEVRNTFVSYFG